MKIKIGLVNDHQLLIDGFKVMLEPMVDFEVVVEALNGWFLKEKIQSLKELPNMMLIDIDMPMMDGVETSRWLRQHYPSIRLIAVVMDDEYRSIVKMLKAGCCSYLFLMTAPEEIKKTLQQVHAKGYFNPDAAESFFPGLFEKSARQKHISLTSEEQRFLHLAFSELSYEEIVHEMNITQKTANKYIGSLYKKFRVESRPGLVLEALQKDGSLYAPQLVKPLDISH